MFCCLVVSRHFLRGRRGGEQPADNRHGFSQLVSPSCLVCSTRSEEALEMVGGLALGLGCLKEIGENLGTHVPRNAGPDTRRRPHAGCQEPGVEKGAGPSISRQTWVPILAVVRMAGARDPVRKRGASINVPTNAGPARRGSVCRLPGPGEKEVRHSSPKEATVHRQ